MNNTIMSQKHIQYKSYTSKDIQTLQMKNSYGFHYTFQKFYMSSFMLSYKYHIFLCTSLEALKPFLKLNYGDWFIYGSINVAKNTGTFPISWVQTINF